MPPKKKGIPDDSKNIDPNNSKFGDALVLVCLEPDSWELSNRELALRVKDVLKKHFRIKNAKAPSANTVWLILNHPNFPKRLKEHRKIIITKAMPRIEKALIQKIIDEGDVRAYDRMLRASGENIEDVGSSGLDHVSDEELNELIEHFVEEEKKGDKKT